MLSNTRLVFISQWGDDVEGINGGNVKKVFTQIKTFKKHGFEVRTAIKNPPSYKGTSKTFERVISKSKNMLPFCTNQAIIHYSDVGKSENYYIRFCAYDYYMFKLLREIKRHNPTSKIVLEYSDYPYLFLEGKYPISDKLVYLREKRDKEKCLPFIDKIATLLNVEELDGKETIRILNGIDVDSIPIKKVIEHQNELHVLIVASLQRSHGVDRFIEGMKSYYKKKQKTDVYLHIVGGGTILSELKDRASSLGDKIIFHGFLFGKELDDIYNFCDMGIEALAPHRKQVKISASLKSREYVARGLPFVSACRLDIDALGFNDYCKVEDSEDSVDIESIVEYYYDFKKQHDQRMKSMRDFAERYLTMDYAMKDVIAYFNS